MVTTPQAIREESRMEVAALMREVQQLSKAIYLRAKAAEAEAVTPEAA